LREADLFHAILDEADIGGARLNKANLFGANLIRTRAVEADFSGAYLKDVLMEEIDASRGSLADTYMLRGVISGGQFVGANLTHMDMTGAAAEGCDFSGADLSGSLLSGASLRDAVFRRSKLTGTDFSNADLESTVFEDAQDMPASLMETAAGRFGFRDLMRGGDK
jgi:uncharacterized protein YjbI with pentapeptide repeats